MSQIMPSEQKAWSWQHSVDWTSRGRKARGINEWSIWIVWVHSARIIWAQNSSSRLEGSDLASHGCKCCLRYPKKNHIKRCRTA